MSYIIAALLILPIVALLAGLFAVTDKDMEGY